MAGRLERLAPSMRDGESMGLLERKAMWVARAYDQDATDVLDDMLWFLWGRPDLLSPEHSDEWLANRCVFFARAQISRARARKMQVVERNDLEWLAAEDTAAEDTAEDESDIAGLLDDMGAELRETALALLDGADELVKQSSGAVNVTRLAQRLGICRRTARARVGEMRRAVRARMAARMSASLLT